MKKIFLLAALIIMSLAAAQISCNKHSAIIPSGNTGNQSVLLNGSSTANGVNLMSPGQIHNHYLDLYIERFGLISYGTAKTLDINFLISKRFNQMMQEDGLLPATLNIDSFTTKEMTLLQQRNYFNTNGLMKSTEETTALNISAVRNSQIKAALEAINNYSGDLNEFSNFGVEKFNEITNLSVQDEKLKNATESIFVSSVSYWSQFQQNNPAVTMGINDVGAADAAGFDRGVLIARIAGITDANLIVAAGAAYAARWSYNALW